MKLKTIALIAALACGTAFAQTVDVKDAWVRTTVQGQMATGAFMKLTAKDGAKLVGASSPAAGVVEVHEMKMDGDVMKMRALADGLKAALPKDSTVPMTLVFKDAKGMESKVEIKVPVATAAPGAPAAKAGGMPAMDHGKH